MTVTPAPPVVNTATAVDALMAITAVLTEHPHLPVSSITVANSWATHISVSAVRPDEPWARKQSALRFWAEALDSPVRTQTHEHLAVEMVSTSLGDISLLVFASCPRSEITR